MSEQLLKAAKDGSVEELVVALTERNVDNILLFFLSPSYFNFNSVKQPRHRSIYSSNVATDAAMNVGTAVPSGAVPATNSSA